MSFNIKQDVYYQHRMEMSALILTQHLCQTTVFHQPPESHERY